MLPRAFASARSLARLNVAAVAATLAGCTAAFFDCSTYVLSGWLVGIPTLVIGGVWAALLRQRKTIGSSSIRWGWVASIPLAALNAGITCAALLGSEESFRSIFSIVGALVLGATVGAIIWVPAMIATLVCFGVPIAWAQRLASKGLAGTERGERIIGAVCVLLGLGAFAACCAVPLKESASGRIVAGVLAAAGALLGAAAFVLATLREQRRAAFVARVEAGELTSFRVDPTPEGKVLVRVETQGAGAYRVADLEEEICLLDGDGRATQVRAA